MREFKLTWRLKAPLWLDDGKWADFLNLIRRHDDVADEVAFFISDDIYGKCTPLEDKQRQADVFAARARDLHAMGKTVGINVWPSFDLYAIEQAHYPDMRRMVNADGERVEGLACPVSEEFLAYIREKYLIFARTGADCIWVDDDCRFTHLDGGYYPCFCDECVRNFENGEYTDRETLVEALNRPENRDLRIRWSAYGADRLAKFCEVVRTAVDEVDPKIDTPFMTVGATHTTFAGDYIEKCMKALRSRRGRPGHGFYYDKDPNGLMWKAMEVGRQVLEYPEYVQDIFVEEESHPCTFLSKSNHLRRNLTSLSLMAGCTGIAFNHQAYNGNMDRSMAREIDDLHAYRPMWEKYSAFAEGLDWCGMWPVHSWFMAAKSDCSDGWFHETEKAADITLPEILGPGGVALTVDAKHACATLIAGETIHVFDRAELENVFSGNVYMDAGALRELEKMGFGEWAGVRLSDERCFGDCYAAEHPFNGPFAGHSYVSISGATPYGLIPLGEGVESLAYVKRYVDDNGGPSCISKYENALGGKVIVNSYDPWHYVDDVHHLYMLASVSEWFGAPVRLRWMDPFVVSRVQPYIRTDGKRAAVMLVNAFLDSTNPFEIVIRGEMTGAVLLNSDGTERALACRREGDCLCVEAPVLGPWELAIILAK